VETEGVVKCRTERSIKFSLRKCTNKVQDKGRRSEGRTDYLWVLARIASRTWFSWLADLGRLGCSLNSRIPARWYPVSRRRIVLGARGALCHVTCCFR